jgi:DNA invertase Pin-like site-specific DNA recombinase
MAWAIDRVGRSLIDLLGTIQHLEAAGVDLYLDIDTTTPMGRLLFQATGAFAEFERSMIKQRMQVGPNSIKAKIAKDGKFETKAGIMRSRLGRPGALRSSWNRPSSCWLKARASSTPPDRQSLALARCRR